MQKDTPQDTGSINRQIKRYEITAVYTHPDAQVDVILLHGLNGNPARTWRSGGDGDGTTGGTFWPSDLLPDSLRGTPANVLVYGYNADVCATGSRSASDNFIFQHAQTLVSCVTLYRKSAGTQRNPILWVAHSLGGLLLKRSLLYSSDLRDRNHEDQRGLFVSTYGIIFLGTPHTGSGLATWGRVLQAMADAVIPKKLFETESILLKTLKRDNETLQNINNHFLDIYQRFKITMAHENHKTDLKGTKSVVVDANSACPQLPGVTYYGIEATHSGMCKFAGPDAPGYMSVSTTLREWVQEASPVIQTRWDVELEDRRERARQEAGERLTTTETLGRLPAYASPLPPPSQSQFTPLRPDPLAAPLPASLPTSQLSIEDREPLFIHPQHFRPNSYFVGRQEESRELHGLLMDSNRRSVGTSAVLVSGMAGSGKTHLARQYVFDHKSEYPGGIYWVRATTIQDMESGFWQIAKTEAIREMIHQETTKDLLDPQKMVEVVRNWFNDFDGWLLVFDGIRFDDDVAIRNFIPDRKHTSLLFTSTESAVAGSHFYDNPAVLELGLLPYPDAQSLLLQELGKKLPYTTDDLRTSLELVKLFDRLPLMIHAAAQQMKATKEPLHKYLKSFKDQPAVGTLPAYQAIREELQARGNYEALNLMHILSFFSQHIPVEMLALGLRALDNRTPVKTPTSRRKSLNGTFVTLIAFALVERIEMEDLPQSSSSSSRKSKKSGDDQDVNPLDILRVHTIIQTFFLNMLLREDEFLFWLERAISVFCESYDRANAKILTYDNLGLPDDYRRYSIHGEKLQRHVERLSSKRRRDPALQVAVDRLRNTLGDIPARIASLQRDVSAGILEGKDYDEGAPGHVSVFERTNSLSTQSTVPALSTDTSSLLDEGLYVRVPDWHSGSIGDHPATRAPDRTATATGDPRGPFESPLTMVNPHAEEAWENGSGWATVEPHRVVKRLDQKRYHDRAGSWRDAQSTNDPRVGVSHASAQGFITTPEPRGASRSSSPAGVHLEDTVKAGLMEIKKASPPPLRGGGGLKGRVPADLSGHVSDGTSSIAETFATTSARSPPTIVAQSSTSSSPKLAYLSGLLGRLTHRNKKSVDLLSKEPGDNKEVSSQRLATSDSLDPDCSTHPAVNVLPPNTSDPWNHLVSPDGYTSQPMSRTVSAQQDGDSTPTKHISAATRSTSRHRGGSFSGGSRPASIVETEPSPRLPSFDIEQTSYQAWERGRRGRARGDSLLSGTSVPLMAARQRSSSRAPSFVSRGGSPSLSGISRQASPRGSPHAKFVEPIAGTSPLSGSTVSNLNRVVSRGGVPPRAAGHEDSRRSGSSRQQSHERGGSEGQGIGLGIS